MQKIIILVALWATSVFSASLSSTEIINMVSEIKKEREGISLVELESTANPFLLNIAKEYEVIEGTDIIPAIASVEVVYNLKAILNKSAFIDTKWYKQGDTIGGYKVGYVSSTSVELKSENANKTLSLEKKKKNFIKLNRGYR